MSATICPFCGGTISQSLKFCISCGRSLNSPDGNKLGGMKNTMGQDATRRIDSSITSASFDLSRKSYSMQQRIRQALFLMSQILLMVIIVFLALRFVFQEVFHQDFDKSLQQLMKTPAPKLNI
jgi:uncharacterized membrane protein YvbJ